MRPHTPSAPNRGFLLAGLVLTLLLIPLTGCDGGGGGNSGTKALHSCELLSVAEIEALIDAKVDTPPRETHNVNEENDFWMSMCNYYAPEPGISLGVMVQPLSPPGDPEKALDVYLSSLKTNIPDYQVTAVDGIGRKAIWSEDTGQLTIFTDKHMVLITSMKPGAADGEKLAIAKNLGKQTLERLQ